MLCIQLSENRKDNEFESRILLITSTLILDFSGSTSLFFFVVSKGLEKKRTRKVPHGKLRTRKHEHGYFECVVLSSCFHINKRQLNKKIASFIIEEFVSNINNYKFSIRKRPTAHYRTNTMSLFSVSIFNESINKKFYDVLVRLIDRQYYDEDSRQD